MFCLPYSWWYICSSWSSSIASAVALASTVAPFLCLWCLLTYTTSNRLQKKKKKKKKKKLRNFNNPCMHLFLNCATSFTTMLFFRSLPFRSAQFCVHHYQEYIRTRVCNSRSFCYECCHGRIRSSSSLPTSVCTKKRKTFILERWTQRWALYFDEHVHAKCRPSLKCQSKRWSFWRERACTCSALSA